MAEITFKQTRRNSGSCDGYREIKKDGDLKYDMCAISDDVINIYTKDHHRITIDCNKKTGVFSIKFDGDKFIIYD